ncbi:MAG: hypothetical protein Q8O84_00365 [Nanoarchaeota archaeon]|nr:hypothetical protein [Nanoarchaeota archaeon]
MVFIDEVWLFLANINYALFDFIIAELIGLFIINDQKYFKKSEYFVFGAIFVGILIFFLSNSAQDFLISKLLLLKFWALIIFLVLSCLNVFLLAKYELGRTWKFRLVWIPLTIIGLIIVSFIVYLIFKK